MSAHILIVDDNPINLKLAADVLESEGFRVTRAVDAEQAQALLEGMPAVPDLTLMDIALPGMDGLTLTRKLRDSARYDPMVIVALTAFAMKGDDDKALAAGCNGYISKPIETRTLAARVAGYMRAKPA